MIQVDFKLIDSILEKYECQKTKVIPIMQDIQKEYKFLPKDALLYVADRVGESPAELYGIATFYSQFKLNPNGQYAIAVCLGTACYVKGSGLILDEISKELGLAVGSTSKDGKYSLEATRCIGACGLAPVMTINGDVYGRLTPAEIPAILAKYKD